MDERGGRKGDSQRCSQLLWGKGRRPLRGPAAGAHATRPDGEQAQALPINSKSGCYKQVKVPHPRTIAKSPLGAQCITTNRSPVRCKKAQQVLQHGRA